MDRSKRHIILNKQLAIAFFLSGFLTLPTLMIIYYFYNEYLPDYIYYKGWKIKRENYYDTERMRTYFFDNRQEFEEMENYFSKDRYWDFSVKKDADLDNYLYSNTDENLNVYFHGDADKIALYGINGRYLEVRFYISRYRKGKGEEIVSYLYVPGVQIHEEDFEYIEKLDNDWYFCIYNYEPIKLKNTE